MIVLKQIAHEGVEDNEEDDHQKDDRELVHLHGRFYIRFILIKGFTTLLSLS